MAPSLATGKALGRVTELQPMNVSTSHVHQFYAWSLKGPTLPSIVSFSSFQVAGSVGA